jgi:hypothetical protein
MVIRFAGICPSQKGIPEMAVDQGKTVQTVWAVVLMAMGVALCFHTPYAVREASDSGFLNFSRYLIGVLLVVGGVKKFYRLHFGKQNGIPPEE